ncbi:hypothetical protein QUF75_02045 [Desulfococcaceae bacterium HSG7]|nr:hypothetical protein [Desulfococcaceae bacterium HSG7]
MSNQILKTDDIETVIEKMTAQRDAKVTWGYTRQARQCNLTLGILHFQKRLEEEISIDENY